MDLTSENVQAVFLDSLAFDDETNLTFRVKGVFNEYLFSLERLAGHEKVIRGFLGHVSTRFYADRGGGHSWLALGLRRDGVRWGDRPDTERLLVLALGIDCAAFCLDRSQWPMFPGGVPYVRLSGDLFRLWATFRRPKSTWSGDSVTRAFDADAHPAPAHLSEQAWYAPTSLKIRSLSSEPSHVAESFYNRIIVDGFFEDNLPSWVLEPETTIHVY